MINKLVDFKQPLAKIDLDLLIKILKQNIANILHLPSQTAKELDEKMLSLIKVINIATDISIPKARFCLKLISRFDEECKDTQIMAKKLQKIWKKEGTEKN